MLEPERIVRLDGDAVVLLDQRRLPDEEVELTCRTTPDLVEAIRTLAVRGAPAIGVAAAYGCLTVPLQISRSWRETFTDNSGARKLSLDSTAATKICS